MGFEYFNTTEIFRNAEENKKYDMGDVLLSYQDTGFTHRWIQPPVACYFVSSLDQNGNLNVAPISMGTAMWGEPPNSGWYYSFNVHNRRQTRRNLMLDDECVISYYPSSLLKESWITGLPIPAGISELDIAKLTPLPSKQVKPAGVVECPVNIECKIINRVAISSNTIFVCKTVGVSLDEEVKRADMANPYEPGVMGIDLLFEVSITGDTPRLNYAKMQIDKFYKTDDKLGDAKHWIGTFTTWMASELERGRINQEEHDRLMDLNTKWISSQNTELNGDVKKELTRLLTDIVWREI